MKALQIALVAVLLTAGSSVAPRSAISAAGTGTDAPWDSAGGVLKTVDVFASGYHRYNLPRRDLTARVGDVAVAPELALGAWAGLSGEPDDATMMGDLVLTSQELGLVLSELVRQRIDVTAIHNHLVGEEPKLIYVHFHAHGGAVDLATRLNHVIGLTGTPRPVVAPAARPLAIDTAAVFQGLGRSGKAHGDVAQVSFILVPGTVTMNGRAVTPALGCGSPINVQMVGPSRAVATGDFAVTGDKVNGLLQALTKHGIVATALHSHMIGESPALYFIHFWADGPLSDVVKGLRAAVDAAR